MCGGAAALTRRRGEHVLDALLALGHRRRLILHLPHRHHIPLQLCKTARTKRWKRGQVVRGVVCVCVVVVVVGGAGGGHAGERTHDVHGMACWQLALPALHHSRPVAHPGPRGWQNCTAGCREGRKGRLWWAEVAGWRAAGAAPRRPLPSRLSTRPAPRSTIALRKPQQPPPVHLGAEGAALEVHHAQRAVPQAICVGSAKRGRQVKPAQSSPQRRWQAQVCGRRRRGRCMASQLASQPSAVRLPPLSAMVPTSANQRGACVELDAGLASHVRVGREPRILGRILGD